MTVIEHDLQQKLHEEEAPSRFVFFVGRIIDWMYATPNPQVRAFFDRERAVNELRFGNEVENMIPASDPGRCQLPSPPPPSADELEQYARPSSAFLRFRSRKRVRRNSAFRDLP